VKVDIIAVCECGEELNVINNAARIDTNDDPEIKIVYAPCDVCTKLSFSNGEAAERRRGGD